MLVKASPSAKVFAKAGLKTKPWKHHDLRRNGQHITDHDVGQGLNQ